ncbi:MAG: hypothetical protein JW754_05955 [Candidatus Aenigmarchaeota archaeon]|nr:hypothetical protein [Candidatus Aenigmarchaeota archaeon]
MDFIEDYKPDHIYTMGFDANMTNSSEITYEDVPGLFFPNATETIYVEDLTKSILASNLAHYMGIPIVFDQGQGSYSEVLDLEGMSAEDIQVFYIEKLKENGDNTNYLVLVEEGSTESLLAGFLAGFRKGYVVFVNSEYEDIKMILNQEKERLEENGFFSSGLNYKKGDSLYLGIIGDSIPLIEFFDVGMEIFDNKDGNTLYTDIWYGDLNGDGFIDIAPGRLNGNMTSISLQISRMFLPRKNDSVFIGEYKYSQHLDALKLYGGMFQAFANEKVIGLNGMETRRIVEERKELPEMSAYNIIKMMIDFIGDYAITMVFPIFGHTWSALKTSSLIFYSLFEFDWVTWTGDPLPFPPHLNTIDENLANEIGEPGILAYFGLGDDYWLIPPKDRGYWQLLLNPYNGSTWMEELNYSRFLYSDHDLSLTSEITKQVSGKGGQVLSSSGIVHDPYTIYSSIFFFRNMAEGKSIGESLMDTVNFNALEQMIVKIGTSPIDLREDRLYLKDKYERVLMGDPAYTPVENGINFGGKYFFGVSPTGSFTSEISIEPEIKEENGMIIFTNADSFLMKQEKPVISVFVREFVLPKGAVINSVDFDGKYSHRFGLEKNFIYNDDHYMDYSGIINACVNKLGLSVTREPSERQKSMLEECIKKNAEPQLDYPYPDKEFWHRENELLDGRTMVQVYVPAMIHMNGRLSKILDGGTVRIDYDSPLEMILNLDNVKLGDNAKINLEIYNGGGEVNGTLYVWVTGNENVNFTEYVVVPAGRTNKEFEFLPVSEGKYEVSVLFDSEIPVGPRDGTFNVIDSDFGLEKKFVYGRTPSSEVVVKQNGTDLNYVRINDHIPGGMTIRPLWYNKYFLPVMVSVREKDPFRGEKIKWIENQFYTYKLANGILTVEVPDIRKAVGRPVGYGQYLVLSYPLSGVPSPSKQTIETTAEAKADGMGMEKTIFTDFGH